MEFKRRIVLLVCGMVAAVSVSAAGLSAGFYTAPVVVELLPEYSYNKSWGSMANFDLKSTMPVGRHFEFATRVQLSTANVYTLNMVARPRIPLKTGELFFEIEPYYRNVARDRTHEVAVVAGFGYRFDYLSIMLGWSGRWLVPFSGGGNVEELANIVYRIEVFCRPQQCKWNISACVSNIDDFQIERWQQPLVMIGARYDLFNFLRLSARVECKPTGICHETGSFYGISARLGVGFVLN